MVQQSNLFYLILTGRSKVFWGKLGMISWERVIFLWRRWFCVILVACLVTMEASAGGVSAEPTKFVALTFDDGPTKNVTPQLLQGLASRYVSATFFLCGYRMEEGPDLVEAVVADGHEIGIHGYRHAFLQNLSPEEVRKDLEVSSQVLTSITGIHPTLFRPPGGLVSETVEHEAENLGLSLIFWSVDPVDWNGGDPQALANTIIQNAKDGDVILMHDLQMSSVEAAMVVIDTLEAQGFQFVTVSELAELKGVALVPGTGYWRF